MRLIIAGLIAALSMTFATAPAQAVTAAIDTNPNLAALAPTSLYTGDGTWSNVTGPKVVSGSITNVYKSPYGGSTSYYAIGANGATSPSFVELAFATTKSVFSFLWGSPDTWNEIKFYNGATDLGSLWQILTDNGKTGFTTGSGAVLVTLSNFAFNKVTFSSTTQALEMGNIAAVPLPAGAALLGGGVALLGLMGWRRKSKATAA